ncbi:MAG: O-antigen ligase family protein, partial [Ignavibacteria bacterium]|nr:O-antigen ligase family protein [Ignavibacteria bacterium]
VLKENIELYSSSIYTGAVIFFISFSFTTALFFLNKFKKRNHKYFLSLLLITNLVILILSNSRGLIVASLLSVFFILLIINKSLFIKIIFSVSVVGIISFSTSPILEDFASLYYRTDTTHREIFWDTGIEIIKDHPITGIGPNRFDKYFYNYAPSYIFSVQEWKVGKHTPHNFFLYFTAENGVLGLIVSGSFFILFFYIAIKTIKYSKKVNSHYFILSVTITGIGIGLFIRTFIEVTGFLYYGFITTDLPFWLCFGILVWIYQKLKMSYSNKVVMVP